MFSSSGTDTNKVYVVCHKSVLVANCAPNDPLYDPWYIQRNMLQTLKKNKGAANIRKRKKKKLPRSVFSLPETKKKIKKIYIVCVCETSVVVINCVPRRPKNHKQQS